MPFSLPSLADLQKDPALNVLEALRNAHADLLNAYEADHAAALQSATEFVRQGQALGVWLDARADRRAVQSLLDYWSTRLYRETDSDLDATLAPFNAELAPELPDSFCPYLGLAAFNEINAEVFFGRRKLIETLLANLQADNLLVVVGTSGSGKSSVVRAGLLPHLKQTEAERGEVWHYHPPLLPGSDPARALRQLPNPLPARSVIVIDQFEEVFTLFPDDAQRQFFATQLQTWIEAGHRVILTLRTDFESKITSLPEAFATRLLAALVRVLPMNAAELREAILDPANRVGLKFESGIVDALVSDVSGEAAALPLLQFTLWSLWGKRQRNRVLRVAYDAVGGGRQALARAADAFYNGLIKEKQEATRRLLLRMVKINENLEVTSQRIRRVDLLSRKDGAAQRRAETLDQLIAARLVRQTEDTDDDDTTDDTQVEVAHEALVRNWPTLLEWLKEELTTVRQRNRLREQAQRWREAQRDPSFLWAGQELRNSETIEDPTPDEEEFIAACHAEVERDAREKEEARQRELTVARQLAEEQRHVAEAERQHAAAQTRAAARQKRLSYVLGAVGGIALLLAIFAGFAGFQAVAQSNVAGTQQSLAEAAQATAVVDKQSAQAAQATAEAASQEALAQEALAKAAAVEAATQKTIAENALADAQQHLQDFRAEQLAGKAQENINADPQLSLLLALASSSFTQSISTSGQQALLDVLQKTSDTPLRTVSFVGHTDAVLTLAYSRDGKWLATGSADGTAIIWNVSDPKAAPLILRGHSNTIVTLAFSPDSKRLATGSNDFSARVWDLQAADPNAAPIVLSGHSNYVVTLAFSPDGQRLATGSWDTTARVWDLSTSDPSAAPLILSGHQDWVRAVAFNPTENGRWLATASDDTTARVWDLNAEDPNAKPIILGGANGHNSYVVTLAFSPDGERLATGSYDFTARVWAWRAPNPNQPLVLTGHTQRIITLAFSPNGARLATGSADTNARVWDLTAPDPSAAPMVLSGHSNAVVAVAFSPDGERLATSSLDNTPRLWDLTVADPSAAPRLLRGHNNSVSTLAFSPDGQWLATGSSDHTAQLWEVTTTPADITPLTLRGHQNYVMALAFPTDSTLTTASLDRTARQWDLRAANPNTDPHLINWSENNLSLLTLSPDGHWLATTSADGTTRVWDLTTPLTTALPLTLSESGQAINALAFSLNGRWLATASYEQVTTLTSTVSLWDMQADPITRVGQWQETDSLVTALAISSDGNQLVLGRDDGLARVVDLTTFLALTLSGHTQAIMALALSADETQLATGGGDGTARVWDLTTPITRIAASTARFVLNGHAGLIRTVAFSPDGQWLATGSDDRTARIWNLTTAEPSAAPFVFNGHNDWVRAVAFSPDGQRLATASDDGTARVWAWRKADLSAVACRSVGRNFTQIEWKQYFPPDAPYPRFCPELPIHYTVIQAVLQQSIGAVLAGTPPDLREALELDAQRNWEADITNALVAQLRVQFDPNVLSATLAYDVHALQVISDTRNTSFKAQVLQTLVAWGMEAALADDPTSPALQYAAALEPDTAKLNSIIILALQIASAEAVLVGDEETLTRAERLAAQYDPTAASDWQRLVTQALLTRFVQVNLDTSSAEAMTVLTKTLAYDARAVQFITETSDINVNYLACWLGSIGGLAQTVLPTCDIAVALYPQDGISRESRGLARALTGDYPGAIEDLQAYVAWAKEISYFYTDQEQWITALESGTNPFDEATLQNLLYRQMPRGQKLRFLKIY